MTDQRDPIHARVLLLLGGQPDLGLAQRYLELVRTAASADARIEREIGND